MKKFITLITILIVSLANAQEDKPIEVPKIAVKIPVGETALIDGISIKFTEVTQDSRCPTNTTCAWEGQVKFIVEIIKDGKTSKKELTIRNAVAQEIVSIDSTKVMALKVTPYPDANIPPAERDSYCLLISK